MDGSASKRRSLQRASSSRSSSSSSAADGDGNDSYFDTIRGQIDDGADVEATDQYGWTLLCQAAAEGQLEIVTLLTDKGADLEVTTSFGSTPLILAAHGGHAAVVGLLLDKGADVEAKDKTNMTALFHAVESQHQEVVELLLERGADAKVINSHGRPLIVVVAMLINEEIMRGMLGVLRGSANVDATDKHKRTALHYAAQRGSFTLVQLLLDAHANPSAEDKDGHIPLHFATKKNIQTLLAFEASKRKAYKQGHRRSVSTPSKIGTISAAAATVTPPYKRSNSGELQPSPNRRNTPPVEMLSNTVARVVSVGRVKKEKSDKDLKARELVRSQRRRENADVHGADYSGGDGDGEGGSNSSSSSSSDSAKVAASSSVKRRSGAAVRSGDSAAVPLGVSPSSASTIRGRSSPAGKRSSTSGAVTPNEKRRRSGEFETAAAAAPASTARPSSTIKSASKSMTKAKGSKSSEKSTRSGGKDKAKGKGKSKDKSSTPAKRPAAAKRLSYQQVASPETTDATDEPSPVQKKPRAPRSPGRPPRSPLSESTSDSLEISSSKGEESSPPQRGGGSGGASTSGVLDTERVERIERSANGTVIRRRHIPSEDEGGPETETESSDQGPRAITFYDGTTSARRGKLAAGEAPCTICTDQPRNAALVPCGHVAMCMRCAEALVKKGGNRCLVCRVPIQSCVRLYLV